MANINAPYGLLEIQSAIGGPSNFEMTPASILTTNTTAIYRNDMCQALSSGYIGQWTATTVASFFVGVFKGVTYLSTSQQKQVQSQYWPGTDVASNAQNSIQAYLVPVAGSASPRFRIQSDATGVAFTNIYNNADVVVGTGTTAPIQSGSYLNTTTIAATATLPLRIEAIYGGPWGAGGYGGVQPSTTNPYGSGGAIVAQGGLPFNWVIVRANTLGAGATGV